MTDQENKVDSAIDVLQALGLPKEQQNERSAYCLLALLDLKPTQKWSEARAPLIGITPIMNWVYMHYDKEYAPNSRETFRRYTMHQFCNAGLALYNPDDAKRPVNSPKAVYQIEQEALSLLRLFGSSDWDKSLKEYLNKKGTLIARYAKERDQNKVPVRIGAGQAINLSPGAHSELIKAIIEEFGARFAPESQLVYAGDTGSKYGLFDNEFFKSIGVVLENHGKMPDVILFDRNNNWLFLIESVTSHGPINGKRYEELNQIFGQASADLVYVTAFPDRAIMARYLPELAWETEVWVASDPSHLVHFNGHKFLGPHTKNQ